VCADANPDCLSDRGVQIEIVYTAICSLAPNCRRTDRRLEVSAEV
jgi:polyphosphate kinase